uniref:TonB-dependent receptor n=1 Tax=Pedobacter schmidteae TaxID=2201271 RepID=UPI001D01A88E|nr:TonB-dependent receptor [Pedobacter schmidteae]
MKVNAILLLVIFFTVSSLTASPGAAQTLSDVSVAIDLNKGTLRHAFSQIEKQTDFRFAYRNELISAFKSLSVDKETRSVKSILDELLRETGLGYKQLNNSIIIFKNAQPVKDALAREIGINGLVTDENKLPLPGVSVKIKGTNKGVTTDANGKYIIQVPDENVILVFSYIGYVTVEAPVKNGRMTNINMKPDIGSLDAVVVVGYGTTTKRNNTGSVASITSKDIASQPVSDPLSALQGRVAGLDVTGTTGYPGSSFNIRLRGINSIGAGNDPLFIVDGIPFISEPMNQFTGANGNSSPLNAINPTDIERVDVLKDADATAIYGSRGANGVILITTKKGKAGKTETKVDVYSGAGYVNHKVDVLNTQQYLALRKEAFANDDVEITEENAPDLKLWDQNANTNWQDKLIGGTANVTQAQLSLSGGSETTNFLMSGTYRKEGTVLPTDMGFQRGSINLNLNHRSADSKFDINTSVKYVADLSNLLTADVTQYYNAAPNFPVYDGTGKYYWVGFDQNPMAFFERAYESKTRNLFGNMVAKYALLPGLNIQASLGYNRMTMSQTQTLPEKAFNPVSYAGSQGYYGENDLNSYIVEPQVNYIKEIGKGNLQLMAGGTWQQTTRIGQFLYGEGYPSDAQLNNPMAAVSLISRGYNNTEYKYTSVFGRATYNYDEKYILNGTFRRDGSSRFGPNKRFGTFGAIGAAWLFGNENFIKDKLNFLSFGKLRGSYGTSGNDQIGDYGYSDSWKSTDYSYAGSGGLFPSRFPNPNYSWEVNKKLEVALELGFLKDRIMLTTSFYRNRSGNQLIGFVLSPQSGFRDYTANLPALVENKGFELELNTVNLTRSNFKWSTTLNFTTAKNKLLEYPGLEASEYADKMFIGQPLNVTMGFAFTGIDPQTGIPQFTDKNNDGETDEENDFFILGTTTPKFYGGILNSFTIKKWSLDFFLQFVKQEGPGLNYGYLSNPYGFMVNKDLSALDRWTAPGQSAIIPGATASASSDGYSEYRKYRVSSALWRDASYIRLKNVSLRYNIGNVIKGWKSSNFTVYVQGQNLFTITNYDGFDPETKGMSLPPLSVYTAGLQLSF